MTSRTRNSLNPGLARGGSNLRGELTQEDYSYPVWLVNQNQVLAARTGKNDAIERGNWVTNLGGC
jgi:hypothetical protein